MAVRLRKALYGHPDAPAFWQAHLEGILTSLLMASVVEGFPSVFWISSLSVLVTIYVDDILAAGRPESLRNFGNCCRNISKSRPPVKLIGF